MAAAKKSSTGGKSGGSGGGAFMKPLTPSPELAKIVGSEPIPRTEVTKRIWDYIREHNLQDPQDKRRIIADDELKPIFGGKDAVSMFELTKLVNGHLKS